MVAISVRAAKLKTKSKALSSAIEEKNSELAAQRKAQRAKDQTVLRAATASGAEVAKEVKVAPSSPEKKKKKKSKKAKK